MLLFLYAFPPLDSIIEILGNSRQSRWFSSAARTKSSAKYATGQCKREKNFCKRTVRGSGSVGCGGFGAGNGFPIEIFSRRDVIGKANRPSTTSCLEYRVSLFKRLP